MRHLSLSKRLWHRNMSPFAGSFSAHVTRPAVPATVAALVSLCRELSVECEAFHDACKRLHDAISLFRELSVECDDLPELVERYTRARLPFQGVFRRMRRSRRSESHYARDRLPFQGVFRRMRRAPVGVPASSAPASPFSGSFPSNATPFWWEGGKLNPSVSLFREFSVECDVNLRATRRAWTQSPFSGSFTTDAI